MGEVKRMYKYGMIEREFGVGCQPKGFVKFEYSDKNKTGYYSYVWYDKKLTEQQVLDFSLELID